MRALLVRGGAVWQLVGLITRRSQVQILPPLPLPKSIVLAVETQPAWVRARRAADRKGSALTRKPLSAISEPDVQLSGSWQAGSQQALSRRGCIAGAPSHSR